MRQVKAMKEFIGNEPDQVVEPEKGDSKENVPKSKKKTRDMKRVNPKKYVDVTPVLGEAKREGTAVISFGRMNPVTSGHEVLVNKVVSTALDMNGTPLIFLSHSSDAKKNPLSYDDKIAFAKTAFGSRIIQKSNARTIIDVAKQLQSKYSDLVVVVGSDRVKEFESLLNKYNGKDYNYDSIQVVSAGERDPDADDVTGMSASKMRALAKDGNMSSFKKGLPRKLQRNAKKVYTAVRDGMGINEETLTEMTQRFAFDNLKKATAAEKSAPRYNLEVDSGVERGGKIFYVAVTGRYTDIMKWMKTLDEAVESIDENKNHPKYREAKKAYKAGVWDGNVNKDGNPIVHINGKPVVVEDFELDENKIYFVKVGDGRDFITVKTKEVNQTAALKKIRGQYPNKRVSLDRNQKQGEPAGTFESTELEEALTRQQRLKRKMIMRRLKNKIAMGRRRSMRRKATIDVLKKRARRHVIRALKKRFAKSRNYDDLPYSARQRIDDRVAKIPSSRIDILMRRMLPKVKEVEKNRIASRISKGSKTTNPVKTAATVSGPNIKIQENINEKFEAFINSKKTDLDKAIELAITLGVNENYAIKEIEKIKKGISKHYLVKEALKSAQDDSAYTEYTASVINEGPTYHTGLAKSTADKRKAQFKKQAKMDDDNPAAYKPAPGDARSKTKPSQHTKKFADMFGESTNYEKAYLRKPHMLLKQDGTVKLDRRFKMFKKQPTLDEMVIDVENIDQLAESVEFIFESNPKAAIEKKAEKTGISYSILKKVFDRGVAAWRTGHRPGTTPTQWGLARINSFATGGKTRTTADKDLWAKHKGNKDD